MEHREAASVATGEAPAVVALAGRGAVFEQVAGLPVGRATAEHAGRDDEADEDEDRVYRGPPIGSKAMKTWPDLLGKAVDDAVAKIEEDRPDVLMVVPCKEGQIVADTVASRRVRVWFDPATNLVTRVPTIG